MICAVIPGPSSLEVQEQIDTAIQQGADLIELRIDLFEEISIFFLEKLLKNLPIASIFTLKGKNAGGNFLGSETEHLNSLRQLAELHPHFLDLDHKTPREFIIEISEKYPSIQLILSYHHFLEMPKDLKPMYDELSPYAVQIYKFAFQAHSSLDALNLLQWAKNTDAKILVVSMGEKGQISRILNPILNYHFTYASLADQLKTAAGQLTINSLNELYAFKKLNKQTKIFGLIGSPVDQSFSDSTHNYYFQQTNQNAVYVKIVILPEELAEFLKLAKTLNFQGLSVTMPLKEAILAHLDFIETKTKKIGACNTVVFKEGQTIGYNTDCIGALNAIEHFVQVKEKKVVIIGAGGAAKAIAYEACLRGAKVLILNRDIDRAKSIAMQLNCDYGSLEKMKKCFEEGYDILINSTPLSSPIDPAHILPNCIVMDINTQATQTVFLNTVQEKNCQIVYGLEMFIRQAVEQFNLWFDNQIKQKECYRLIKSKLLERLKESVDCK